MFLKNENLKKTILTSVIALSLSFASLAQAAETYNWKFQSSSLSGSSEFKVEQLWAKT